MMLWLVSDFQHVFITLKNQKDSALPKWPKSNGKWWARLDLNQRPLTFKLDQSVGRVKFEANHGTKARKLANGPDGIMMNRVRERFLTASD